LPSPLPTEGPLHGHIALALSVAALLLGPVIHRVAQRERVTMAALDSFVLVAVAGLVVVEILPGALGLAGLPALLALVLGLLAPSIAEGPLRRSSQGTHRAALAVAILGMALHAFTDGLALAGAHVGGATGHGVEIALIAHQLPVAVSIWWLMNPLGGALRAALVLALIAAATVAGYLLAARSLELLDPSWVGLFQALIGGLLLHVVAHRVEAPDPSSPRARVASALGGLAGLSLLAATLASDHGHDHGGADAVFETFLELSRAAAPVLLVILFAAALIASALPVVDPEGAPPRWPARLARGLRLASVTLIDRLGPWLLLALLLAALVKPWLTGRPHQHAHAAATWPEELALLAVAGLLLASFIRQTPRVFLGKLWSTGGHDHRHEHGRTHGAHGHEHHDHDHGPPR
jgi:hypothetical protein